nr:hypothetical protein [Tanacetum cinerariifolium]
MVWRGTSLRYETGEKKVNEVYFISQVDCMMVVKEIENELLEEVEASHFGEEKLEWWFEQDIDDEGEKMEVVIKVLIDSSDNIGRGRDILRRGGRVEMK